MTINCHIKNVYGNDTIYVTDAEARATISRLTGKKTVDRADIASLNWLGITIILNSWEGAQVYKGREVEQ